MADLAIQKMNIGFALFAVAAFVWASVDYNRFIKFWMIRPAPYSMPVTAAFRVFFAACFVGGAWHVVDVARVSQLPITSYFVVLLIAVAWFAAFVLMLHLVERMNRKRTQGR